MNALQTFIAMRGIRQADFAASIGTTQSMVSRLINGVAVPSLELAAKIERATGGAVMAASWSPAPTPDEDAA